MVTAEDLQKILEYKPETGDFLWRLDRGRIRAGRKAGCVESDKSGLKYVRIGIFGRPYRAHRLAWLYSHGSWPDGLVDHINGDTLDNRLRNLRVVTPQENQWNAKVFRGSSGAVPGVARSGNRWVARVSIYCDTKDDAEAIGRLAAEIGREALARVKKK